MKTFSLLLISALFLEGQVEAIKDKYENTVEDWETRVQKKYDKYLETYELEIPEEWKNRVPQPAPTEKSNRFGTRSSGSGPSKSTYNTVLSSTDESDVKASYVGSKPHILVFLMDDLGYHDVGYTEEPRKKATLSTPYITKLAKEEGIILTRHYAHWHCSPSRRAFLSGRLPVHSGGENLSDFADDDMDVRFTWLSEKLNLAGYRNFFYGKHHLGVRSVKMLPIHRGFNYHFGFIQGSMQYTSPDRWVNFGPYTKNKVFSTKAWGDDIYSRFKRILESKPDDRLFLYASMQSPHSPLINPPSYYAKQHSKWSSLTVLDKNMFAVDVEMKRILSLFKKDEGVWNNTLVVFLSDNGGTKRENIGNNYPLRSEKGSSFEGAYRVTSFITGGIVPPSLRGTKNDKITHIVDWYRTFCNLAGVDGDDDPPEPIAHPNLTPKDVYDPQIPTFTLPDGTKTNPYGESYPKVDSVDLWPMLMRPGKYAQDAARPYLVLGTEAIIKGDYKLVIGQPCANGIKGLKECKDGTDFGWDPQEDNLSPWLADPSLGCLKVFDVRKGLDGFTFEPCLFNLATDEREQFPINDLAKIEELWADLNQTLVYQYNTELEGKDEGVSPPECLGPCVTPNEATARFKLKRNSAAPRCGLDKLKDVDWKFCDLR